MNDRSRPNNNISAHVSRRWTWAVLLLITLGAALPRFYGLDRLGFYGDEETTALPARALVETGEPRMPSGMPYHRALPLTYLNAISGRIFGTDREISYRLPAAVMGTLTIPLLFLLARPFVGSGVALTAAVLLALSEWHILTSREARMYAPFLLFYTLSAFAIWGWTRYGGGLRLLGAVLCVAGAIAFHSLGMLAAALPLLAIAFPAWCRIPVWQPLALALAIAGGAALYNDFVSAPYEAWSAEQGHTNDPAPAQPIENRAFSPSLTTALRVLAAAAGFGFGLWLARRTHSPDSQPGGSLRILARYIVAGAATAATMAGQLYGAALAWTTFLLLHPDPLARTLRRGGPVALILPVSAAAWLIAGTIRDGALNAVKESVMHPFPYLAVLGEMMPGVSLLFLLAIPVLIWRTWQAPDFGLRAGALAVVLPLTAVGLASQWGGVRYLIEIYPFMLILGAFALVSVARSAGDLIRLGQGRRALILALLAAASGVLGGHGVPDAWRIATADYRTSFDRYALGFPLYPDHRGAGLYVREHLRPDDVVVAEDVLEQYWYVGRVDYWLRDAVSHHRYLYQADDGHLRDFYVNSRIFHPDDDAGAPGGKHRIWVITSGETRHARDFYLDANQRAWLASIESRHAPIFIAADGVTRVYRLNGEADRIVSAPPGKEGAESDGGSAGRTGPQ